MIVRNKKEITAIHRNGRNTMKIMRFINGAWRSVWQAIQSCFGSGFWANLKPWFNREGWKND